METVLFVVHIMVVLALIVMVLLQRTEGGALGIGGGGGNMSTSRSTGDIMTKITTGLALAFFLTSIGIALIGQTSDSANDILDRIEGTTVTGEGVEGEGGGVLDALGGSIEETTPAVPTEPQVPTGN